MKAQLTASTLALADIEAKVNFYHTDSLVWGSLSLRGLEKSKIQSSDTSNQGGGLPQQHVPHDIHSRNTVQHTKHASTRALKAKY